MTNLDPHTTKYMEEGPFLFDDGAFCVWKNRFGVWQSASKDGTKLLSAPTKESCEDMTRWKLAGYPGGYTTDTGIKMTGKDTL